MYSLDKLTIDTPEQIALELPLAGIGSRFLALAIDTILQSFLYVLLMLAAIFLRPPLNWIPPTIVPALTVFFLFCLYWGYFAFFEIVWKGQTPGKRLTGIRVIKDIGRPINTFEGIARNLMRAIDSLPGMYGVGIISMMLSQQHRRLGDYVAGTVVIHDKTTSEVRPQLDLAGERQTAGPQLARIWGDDLVLIETYLHRRYELDPVVRATTAQRIVALVKERTGAEIQLGQSDDDFLEAVAREARHGARYRS